MLRYPWHPEYRSSQSQLLGNSNYSRTPTRLLLALFGKVPTDDVGRQTSHSGENIDVFACIYFLPEMSSQHIALTLNHVFHFRDVPSREEVCKRRFVVMMLIAVLLGEKIAYSFDTVELIVVRSFDKRRDLRVDSSVG